MEVTYHCFYGLLGLWKKGVIGEVIVCEMGFDGFETRYAFDDDFGSVSGATELEVFFDHAFQLLLQLNQVDFGRQDYWGWPTCLSRNRLFLWIGLLT
jgi:hypothetical protein